MKTNITMKSTDRVLFGVTIRQETKTQFLSVTDLQEAYTRARVENGWSDRKVADIFVTNAAVERIFYILKEQGILETSFVGFMKEVTDSSLVKVLKKYGAYKTVGARKNKQTMCNPYVWMMLALELNPALYAKVVMWLTDNLIINRIEAGDKYNDLCRAISKFKDVDYRSVAKGINYIVFNVHETQIRDTATAEQLKEIDDLQKSLAFAVDMGYIMSMDELIGELRKLWYRKWGNKFIIGKKSRGHAVDK